MTCALMPRHVFGEARYIERRLDLHEPFGMRGHVCATAQMLHADILSGCGGVLGASAHKKAALLRGAASILKLRRYVNEESRPVTATTPA
jgi:hypothetical protein